MWLTQITALQRQIPVLKDMLYTLYFIAKNIQIDLWYKQPSKIKPKHRDYTEHIVLYLNTTQISENATLYTYTALHDTKHSKK